MTKIKSREILADMSEIAISTIKKIESGEETLLYPRLKKSWISLAWRLNMRFVKQFKYSQFLPICFQKEQTER